MHANNGCRVTQAASSTPAVLIRYCFKARLEEWGRGGGGLILKLDLMVRLILSSSEKEDRIDSEMIPLALLNEANREINQAQRQLRIRERTS